MSDRHETTSHLVDDLVSDLEPVRLFPSLAAALALVLAVWAAVAVGAAYLKRPPLDFVALLGAEPWIGLVLLGLVAGAVAGTLSAIAGVVPGRDRVEQQARLVAFGGLALAVAVGLAATTLGLGRASTAFSHDASCFAMSVGIGLAPAVSLVLLERRGFVQRPRRSAMLALLGSFTLGGLAVQLVCHHPGARHMLCGHVLVPVVMIALGLLPLAALLRRSAEQSRAAR